MLGNERDLKIAKIRDDHHARLFKHDIIFDIYISSNKLIFIYNVIKFISKVYFY